MTVNSMVPKAEIVSPNATATGALPSPSASATSTPATNATATSTNSGYDSESVSGGGTISGITYAAGGKENQVATHTGFFVKVPAAPSQDTTLIDYDAIADGYVRVKLTPQLHVIAEYLLAGHAATLDLGAITTGAFYWVEVGNYHHFDGGAPLYFQGLLQAPGSVTVSNPSINLGNIDADYMVSTRLGVGVSLSSGYDDFPNTIGWELSKPLVESEDSPGGYQGLRNMPTGDLGPENSYTTMVAYYTVRQPVGPAQVLVDTSGNGYNLAPGPQGLTINLDGPYVSPYAPTAAPTGPSKYEVGCGCNSVEGKTTDIVTHYPVNTATGDFFHTFTDLSVPGRGIPLEVTRTYNSIFDNRNGPFGYGWSANDMASAMTDPSGAIIVTEDNGTSVTFDRTSSGYKAPSRVRATLVANDNGTLSFTDVHTLTRLTFTSPTSATAGQLVGMTDRNGYTTALTYTNGLLTKVTDPAGRSLTFGYNGPHITHISDPIGRTVVYTYSTAGDLTDVRDMMGNVTHFAYYSDTHLLWTMTDPRSGVVTNVYDGDGRVLSQTDPLSRTTTFSYDFAAGDPLSQTTTITDPRGDVTVEHYRNNELLLRVEGLGTPKQATWAYTYDPTTLGVATETDPNGHATTKTYDINGNLTSRTDTLGRVTSYAYDPLNDTTAITAPLGIVTRMTYDAHGDLLSTSRPLVATSANNGTITMTSTRRSAVVAAACQGSAATPLCGVGVQELAGCAGRCNPTIGATGERGRPAGHDVVRTFLVPPGQPVLGLRDGPTSRGARTPTSVPSRARPASRKARDTRSSPSCSTSRTRCATATLRRPVPPSTGYRSRDTVISVDDSAQGSGTDHFHYVGRWGHCKSCRDGARIGMYDRSSSFSRRAGDSYTLRFRGIGIALYSVHGPTHGIEEVTLDGRHHVLIDLYSTHRTGDVLDHWYAHLADGVHVLTVRVTGRKNRKSGNVYVVADRVAITHAGIIPPRHTPTPPAATATRVATHIPTPTPTTTPRSTATPSPTTMPPTTTPSAQPAPTAPTPTPMSTATPTPTPTDTPTAPPIPPTNTSTATPSATTTATMIPPTSTPTNTATAMPPSATATGTLEASSTLPAGTVSAATGTPASPTTTTSPAATVMAESTATSTFAPTARTTATPSPGTATATATASSTATSTDTSTPSPSASPTATRTALPSIPCADAGPYTATTCLTYDPAHPGDVIGRTDPDGHTARYTYDQYGNLASASDPLGDATTYTYDLIGRRTSATRPLGNVAGTSPTSYTTAMAYDAFGDTTAITDALGHALTYQYDPNQNLITTTDQLGRQTINAYDLDNEKIGVLRPDGGLWRTGYDFAGNVVTQTDPLGHSTVYGYDPLDRRTRSTDALGRTTLTSYDPAGNVITMTDPLGNVTIYGYDAANERTSIQRPDGGLWQTGYDLDGRVNTTTDALGNLTQDTYDTLGRRTSTLDPMGRLTQTGYDLARNVITQTDALGRVTVNTYDAANRRTSTERPDGTTVQTQYDADGNVIAVTDANGHTTHDTYDVLDRLTATSDALGHTTQYAYDDAGNRTRVIDANNHTTIDGYDAMNRVITATDALGHSTLNAYDLAGNLTTTTDALSHTTVYGYDAANERTSVTQADGSVLGTGYDADGNVITQTDGLGRQTSYGYDVVNQVVTTTNPLAETTVYTYDLNGNRTALTDPMRRTTRYGYDADNEPITITYGDPLTPNVRFTYDKSGQRQSMTDGTGTTSYSYDLLDRPITVTNGAGQTLGYRYDGAGNLTRIIYPDSSVITRTYDAADRWTALTDPSGHTFQFGYDPGNRLTSEVYPTGAPTMSTIDYNDAGQVTGIRDQQPGGLNWAFSYSRDNDGQVSGSVDPVSGVSHAYRYSALNQLTADQQTTGAGTTTLGYSPDSAYQVTRIVNGKTNGTSSETYDLAGELTQMQVAGPSPATYSYGYNLDGDRTSMAADVGSSSSYGYDQADRLISATVGTTQASYGYDGDGLRQSKIVTTTQGVSTTLETWSTVEGLPLLLQDGMTTYLTGPDGLPLEAISGTTVQYLLHDQLGSIRGVLDSGGALVGSQTYDPYGNLEGRSETVSVPFGFAGQLTDAETGFEYLRARYYDPATSQFITTDPLQSNTKEPYAYATSDPLNNIDPSGLRCYGFDPLCSVRETLTGPNNSNVRTALVTLNNFDNSGLSNAVYNAVRPNCMQWAQSCRLDTPDEAGRTLGEMVFGLVSIPFGTGVAGGPSSACDVGAYDAQVARDQQLLDTDATNANLAMLAMGGAGPALNLFRVGAADAGTAVASRFATESDTAYFWSGRTNGVASGDVVQQTAQRSGGTTLETLMRQRGIHLPPYDETNPASVQAWMDASREYAANASGTVRVVLGKELRAGNIWEPVEYPTLLANPKVTRIIVIDPATGESSVLLNR